MSAFVDTNVLIRHLTGDPPDLAERAAIAFDAVKVVDRELLLRAVEVYEVNRLDFADASLVASAERSRVGAIASFDRRIDKITTVTRIEPPVTPEPEPHA